LWPGSSGEKRSFFVKSFGRHGLYPPLPCKTRLTNFFEHPHFLPNMVVYVTVSMGCSLTSSTSGYSPCDSEPQSWPSGATPLIWRFCVITWLDLWFQWNHWFELFIGVPWWCT
jgi:hypothetical protein